MKQSITSLAVLAIVGANLASAQINYNGGIYAENFDGLLNSGSLALTGVGAIGAQASIPSLAGWQDARVAGTATTAFTIVADTGTATTGRVYSYGSASATDRALGSLASGTTAAGVGASFLNSSADTFRSITLSFDREIWTVQGTTTTSTWKDTLSFAYGFSSGSIGGSSFLTNSSMTAFSALDAFSPASNEIISVVDAVNPVRARDGNSATYQQNVTATIPDLNWAPGETLFIRWNDTDTGGFDAGIGIDNLTLVAVIPEPSCGALLGLGIAALSFLRRKNA